MFRKSATNNESGVALLFALGILSLLLILGLAFASNALLAQKVAANNSNRSQAKLLAQSAISRIAIAVMYYQYQATTHSPVVIPIDYSDVYSYGQDRDNRVFADGLFSTNDSLLTPPSSVTTDTPTSTTYEKPKWAFVFDKPESDSDRKIIGRIAYQQVKGSSGMSKISLNNVLRGVYAQESHSTGTPVVTNQIPWTNRWGKSIDELNLNNTTPLNNWEGLKPDESSLDVSSLPSFFGAYQDPGEYFYDYTTVDSQGYKNKSFIERWFTGGTNPMEPEYYRYNITSSEYRLLHRFNLGELDDCDLGDEEWYDRFRNDTSVTLSKNSDAILDRLAHDGVEFRLTDDNTPADTGIPFLKQIADTPETFASLADRRKQIAANLNDYCDSDSKPTSDVDATNWSVEGVTEPTFTGNERTPYLYELGYQLAIHQGNTEKTAGIAAGTDGTIRFQLDLYPAVKLVQIYKNVPDGFSNFTVKNSVREITLEGKITEATYTGIKYEYTDAAGNPQSDTVNVELPVSGHTFEQPSFSYTWNSTSTNALHVPADTENSLTFNPPLGNYPFQAADMTGTNRWYGDYQSEAGFLKTDKAYLEAIVKAKTGNDPTNIVSGPTSITVNKADITRIAVKRGPMLLQGTYSDAEGGSSTFGVDYVRSAASALESTETITFSNSTADTEESSFKFLLGGIRGIDPRQNLNENDWFVAARVARGDAQWDAVMDVTSDTPITGKANALHGTDAPPHPFDPGAATDTSRYDIERQAANNGPAWGDDTNHLSTTYIRNAPMQSLWELGVIHRGAAWQTLNLKAAGAPGGTGTISPSDMRQGLSWDNSSGTSYAEGDGGILEQVKLTEKAYSYGLVNINMLCSDTNINEGYQSEYDDQMGQALFYYIKYGQEINDFETNGTGTALESTESTSGVVSYLRASTNRPFASRTQFLDWSSGGNSLANAFGVVSMTDASDAQQEEIVGKTINLLKAEQSASNVIQFIVVAQTIRDVAGTGITKINPENNTAVSRDCQYGVFDAHRYKNGSTVTTDPSNTGEDTNTSDQSPDDYLYFDEITSEVKMLVTLERVSEVTGQIVVTSIEYID